MEPARHPFQFEDPRQVRIYRRLRDFVGPGPADFFKDACQLMSDPASLGTTSHLVSHLLREIEGALRDVLETLGEREQRLQKSKTDENDHKEEIFAILRGLQIPETDPVAVAWLRLPGKGNSYGLGARAHRNALTFARPVDDDFRQFWNDMQGIFDVVLEKFETRYLGVYQLLDQLLAKPVPGQADVDKLKKNVPNNLVTHGYFFERLASPSWLDLLQTNGLFNHPPAPDVDNVKGTIGYSAWPQSRYLARMTPLAPEKVLAIMLTIPETDNFRIYDDLAVAAASMPAELAAKWSEREVARINKQNGPMGLLPRKLGALVNHLLQGGQVEAALSLARSLLEVLPDPRPQKQKDAEDDYRLPPKPCARCSAWEYRRIIERMIPLLPPKARIPAFDLFCDLLEQSLTLSKNSSDEEPGAEDYSYIWYPHLEDNPGGDHLKNILVAAVRDAAHAIAVQDPTQLPAFIEKLEKRHYEIFHRIALDLLRRFPDTVAHLISARLTDRRFFDARGTRHEYELLAIEWFGKLKAQDQQKILAWIEAGPDDDEAYKRWHKEWSGQEPSDEEIVQHKKRWQRDHLTPLHKSLSPEWKQRYEELTGELGKPERDFTENSRVEVWRGPTSPMTEADFQTMNVQEIVTFLGSWEPTREPMSPSREGLGWQLTETVHKTPLRFASEAARFQGLDPTYVRAFLQGIRQAVSETKDLPWSDVVSLCQWIVGQPIVIEGRQVDKWGDDPDWGWTRKTIAGLLGAGLQEGLSMIPFDLRDQVWSILEILANDPDPTPDEEASKDGPIDPTHIAINSTRGEAMLTVVRYSLWVRSYLEKQTNGAEKVARGFQEMPEVLKVLETHLDMARDPSLAIRSVYGRWLPWLAFLDADWTKNHLRAIFPREARLRQYRDAAWDTYIAYCQPYINVFDILKEEYREAIDRLGSPGTTRQASDGTTDTHLAEHLMVYYWLGKLPLEDSTGILARFYQEATDRLRGEALEFIGRVFSRPDVTLSAAIAIRLKKLWENRLPKIRASGTPADHTAELAAFGWWFVTEKFEDAWAIAQLLVALSLVQKTEPDHLVVERLVTLVATMPLEAVQCLTFMVQGDHEGWNIYGWRDDARKILATAIGGENPTARQAAVDLINRLAARGKPDYKDILPGSPQSSPPAA